MEGNLEPKNVCEKAIVKNYTMLYRAYEASDENRVS